MADLCKARIVIVTGAGRGIGGRTRWRSRREGARVVVNDLGVARDGTGGRHRPGAARSSTRSRAAGGEAVANGDDIADWDGARRLVQTAIDTFGGLDVLVNNAGFLRDRMIVHDQRGRVGRRHPRAPQGPLRAARATRPSTGASRRRRASRSTAASSTRRRAPGSWAASARARTPRPRPGSPRSRSSRRPRWAATA